MSALEKRALLLEAHMQSLSDARQQSIARGKMLHSPEVIALEGYDGCVADAWSLGVCLFALATGALPWGEAHPSDERFAAFAAACGAGCRPSDAALAGIDAARGVPAGLGAALDGLLVVDPRKRTTVAQLAASSEWRPPS